MVTEWKSGHPFEQKQRGREKIVFASQKGDNFFKPDIFLVIRPKTYNNICSHLGLQLTALLSLET